MTVVSPDLEAVETIRTSLAYEQLLGASYSVSLEGVYAQFENAQRLVNINVVPSGLTYGNLVELIGEVFNVFNEEIEFVGTANQQMFTGSLTGGVWSFRRNSDFGQTSSFNTLSVPRQYQVAVRLRY